MELNESLERLADILDVELGKLTPETRLDKIGWDSMGMLSVIALAKSNGRTITGEEIRSFSTVEDVLKAAF